MSRLSPTAREKPTQTITYIIRQSGTIAINAEACMRSADAGRGKGTGSELNASYNHHRHRISHVQMSKCPPSPPAWSPACHPSVSNVLLAAQSCGRLCTVGSHQAAELGISDTFTVVASYGGSRRLRPAVCPVYPSGLGASLPYATCY